MTDETDREGCMNLIAGRIKVLWAALLLLLAGGVALSGAGGANSAPLDTITLTSPNNLTIRESDDYATQVLGDPWDMNNLEDVDFTYKYNARSVSNGVWTANSMGDVNFNNGSFLVMQYQNFRQVNGGVTHTFYSYLGEKDGVNHPIETNRFTHLRARVYASGAGQRGSVLYFFPAYSGTPSGNSNLFQVTPGGWRIVDVDLTLGGQGGTGNWRQVGTVSGLRLDLNPDVANNNVQIDWVRLTPATGEPVRITWDYTSSGNPTVNLYLSTSADPAANEMLIGTAPANARAFTWEGTGMAPGTYYIHAEMNGARASSGPLHVNTSPLLKLDSPGPAAGEDFSYAQSGVGWESHNSGQFQDYRNVRPLQFGTQYMSTSATGGDPQLSWRFRDMASRIDTSRYRYLNVRWRLLPPVETPHAAFNAGPRLLWAQGLDMRWQVTEASLMFYNVWTNMAWDLPVVQLSPPDNTQGWVGQQATLRFDPHEHDEGPPWALPREIQFASARLMSYPYSDRATLVRWTPLQGAGTVDLYYDTDNRGFDGVRFAQGLPLSSGFHTWNTAGLPNGTYYVYAVTFDARNSSRWYSLSPLKIDHSGAWKSTIFADMPNNHWATNMVNYMATQGYVVGYPQGDSSILFRPGNSATRAQLSKMVVLAAGYNLVNPASPTFADVAPSNSLYTFVETAAANGVVTGYPCGGANEPCDGRNRPYYRPNNNVTRAQTAKMISVSRGWQPVTPASPTFADVSPQSSLYGYVEAAYQHGTIGGYPCGGPGEPCDGSNRPYFRPGNSVTRAQLSKMLSCAIGGGAPCE
jgi:hypothetical protein